MDFYLTLALFGSKLCYGKIMAKWPLTLDLRLKTLANSGSRKRLSTSILHNGLVKKVIPRLMAPSIPLLLFHSAKGCVFDPPLSYSAVELAAKEMNPYTTATTADIFIVVYSYYL